MDTSDIGYILPAPPTAAAGVRHAAFPRALSGRRKAFFAARVVLRKRRGGDAERGAASRLVRCAAGEAEEKGSGFEYKFDPNSEKDAFGRDPKKETEFWMDAARSVLDSEEVQQAVADHAEKGGDGLTDEQRAYMEFIKSMDEGKGDS